MRRHRAAHRRGTSRGDPRGGGRALRRHRAARHLDRDDRPRRRRLAAVPVPALRHQEGALHGRRAVGLPGDAGGVPPGGEQCAPTPTTPSGAWAMPTSVLISDRRYLDIQMQAYATCDDADVRARRPGGLRRPVKEVVRHTRATPQQLAAFLGRHAAQRGDVDGRRRARDGVAGQDPRRAASAGSERRGQARPSFAPQVSQQSLISPEQGGAPRRMTR